MSAATRPPFASSMPPADPRLAAFAAPGGSEVFHPIAHRHEVARPDPYDVETIHPEARAEFLRLAERAASQTAAGSGRILLLLGEAGGGKTHLMRAFRNAAHGAALGYCGYLQMTSATEHYGRYLLNNLVDSLDQPYFEPHGETTGLMRLSTAVAASAADAAPGLLDRLRDDDDEIGVDALARVVDELAERVVMDDRYDRVDFDLVRALLYLQRDDARVRGRVLKYLRCEDLSPADRRALGGIVPRAYGDAPEWLLEKLGGIMAAVDSSALVLLVDQLEDLYNMDDAPRRFRRAMATLRDLTDRVPSSVVVVACLEDFYETMRADLTRPVIDRLENDPPPIHLKGNREADEVVRIVARRLDHLYRTLGVAPADDDDDPTFPIPRAELEGLAGLRARDVLAWCHDYREAVRHGETPAPSLPRKSAPDPTGTTRLEQLWNDFRNTWTGEVPSDDTAQLALLAWAIGACSDEVATGHRFTAEVAGVVADVTCHTPDGSVVDRLVLGVCNKPAQGGGLKKQIVAMELHASAAQPPARPVVVRSTEFPTSPTTLVVKELNALMAKGGRRAVVADADWRAMLALRAFRDHHAADPALAAWLRRERPLSQRQSLRAILGLDQLGPVS